jgi:hypothetical protein
MSSPCMCGLAFTAPLIACSCVPPTFYCNEYQILLLPLAICCCLSAPCRLGSFVTESGAIHRVLLLLLLLTVVLVGLSLEIKNLYCTDAPAHQKPRHLVRQALARNLVSRTVCATY